jgi:hypothetical protein
MDSLFFASYLPVKLLSGINITGKSNWFKIYSFKKDRV